MNKAPEGTRRSSPWASLERARLVGAYSTGGLIIFIVVGSVTGFTEHIDIGVLATLVGMYVTLLGLGQFVKMTEPKPPEPKPEPKPAEADHDRVG